MLSLPTRCFQNSESCTLYMLYCRDILRRNKGLKGALTLLGAQHMGKGPGMRPAWRLGRAARAQVLVLSMLRQRQVAGDAEARSCCDGKIATQCGTRSPAVLARSVEQVHAPGPNAAARASTASVAAASSLWTDRTLASRTFLCCTVPVPVRCALVPSQDIWTVRHNGKAP